MKLIKFIYLLIPILLPVLYVSAQTVGYEPLVGIPGLKDTASGNADFDSFINSLYYLSIGIAALLAVIKIIIAGVKYMLSDVVTNKGEAKKDIQGALIGLLVVLGAVLILTVINPQLVNVDFRPEKLTVPPPVPVAPEENQVYVPSEIFPGPFVHTPYVSPVTTGANGPPTFTPPLQPEIPLRPNSSPTTSPFGVKTPSSSTPVNTSVWTPPPGPTIPLRPNSSPTTTPPNINDYYSLCPYPLQAQIPPSIYNPVTKQWEPQPYKCV